MFVMVDIEADGPIPGDYSMVSLGAVIVEPSLSQTFYGQLRPVSKRYVPEALAVSGHSREEPRTSRRAFDTYARPRTPTIRSTTRRATPRHYSP